MKVFSLFFGGIWTMATIIITAVIYLVPGDIIVDGIAMSRNEFNELLMPKIIIAIFWAIGLAFLFVGLSLVIKDIRTKRKGEDCFAKVLKISHTNVTINGYPQLNAKLLVYVPSLGVTKQINEVIGTDPEKYPKSSIVRVKYHNNDVVIIGKADKSELSFVEEEQLKIREEINEQTSFNTGVSSEVINTSADEIEINGVKYRRIDE